MADKQEEKLSPTSTPISGGDTAQTQADKKPTLVCTSPKASRGEKIFNWVVYGGLNYWVNLGVSLVLIDYLRNLGGRKYLNKAIDATTSLLNKAGMAEHNASKFSKTGWEQLTFPLGGWAVLIPSTYMENNKRKIVHSLNKKLGVAQLDSDGKELGPEEIYLAKEQPHQTTTRAVGRRILSMAAVWTSGMTLRHTIGEDKVTNFVTDNANKVLNSGFVPGGKKMVSTPWVQRYIGYAALDAIYTKVVALVMHFTSGAKHAKKPHQVDKEAPDPPQIYTPPVSEQPRKQFTDSVKPRQILATKDSASFVETQSKRAETPVQLSVS